MVKRAEIVATLVTLSAAFTAIASESSIVDRYADLERRTKELIAKYQALQNESLNTPRRFVDIASLCEGRLTTESGVPVSTANRTNQSTIYFTPYKGNRLSLFNGSTWNVHVFTERSLALSGLTANQNYDVFIYDNSGTLTLELIAWSTATARATAIILQDGIYVRSGATTRRYLGTIRTTSTTQTQDTETQRFVWNYQNQLQRYFYVYDTTNSWTYNTNAWRSANNSTANRIELVLGIDDVMVEARVLAVITNFSGTLNYYSAGLGIDSTSTNSINLRGSGSNDNMLNQCWGEYKGYPGMGYHYLQWLERAPTTSVTVYGDNGDATQFRSGLAGEYRG